MDRTYGYVSSTSNDRVVGAMEPRTGTVAPDGLWIAFPEEAGRLIAWEDQGAFMRRKGFARHHAALTMAAGALVSLVGVVLLILLYEEPLSEGLDSGLTWMIAVGFVMFAMAGASASTDCNTWRMAFFTNGIGLLIPQIGHWELFFVPWSEFHTCRHVDHPSLGPILQLGYGGQRLFVLGSMEGFWHLEGLIVSKLRPRSISKTEQGYDAK